MSDDQQPAVPAPRKSSFLSTLIWLGVAVMVAAVAALVLYFVLLRPRLSNDNSQTVVDPGDKLNPDSVTVDFPESVASVKLPEDSQLSSAYLSYEVSLECNSPVTASLVQKHIARFKAMIHKQHEFKTRAELDDPRVKAAIQKAILLEANTILKQLQPGPVDPSIRVTDVFHTRYLVSDQ